MKYQEFEFKISKLEKMNSNLREHNKELKMQVDSMGEEMISQENQLNEAEGELEEINHLKGLVQDQSFELQNKTDDIKRLNKKICELKKDVFYKNKNYFEHHILRLELENQKKEKEVLRNRIIQLEADYNHLRIETEFSNESPEEQKNYFAKKIYKIENAMNDLTKENLSLKKMTKIGGASEQMSLKSSLMSAQFDRKSNRSDKKAMNFKKKIYNQEDLVEENKLLEELKNKINQLEMEKKMYIKKNIDLVRENEQYRNKVNKEIGNKNSSMIDEKEFKKRLSKYSLENHELKDKIQDLEKKIRNFESQILDSVNNKKNINDLIDLDNKLTNNDNLGLQKALEDSEKKLKDVLNDKKLLEKEISNLKFELEGKQKEVKTLTYKLMEVEETGNSEKIDNLVKKNINLGKRVLELESQLKICGEMESENYEYPEDEIDDILMNG